MWNHSIESNMLAKVKQILQQIQKDPFLDHTNHLSPHLSKDNEVKSHSPSGIPFSYVKKAHHSPHGK